MTDHEVVGRSHQTGRWISLTLDSGRIRRVEAHDGPDDPSPTDPWLAPAFWDLQTNGRWGISFSDPTLTVEQVAAIVRANAGLGTARLCPTLITASPEATTHGLRTIAAACDRFPDVAARVLGIHLEGPYLSERDGYRGAHPLSAVRDPSWDEFASWQEASGGRVRIMTLAPERPGSFAFIRRAVESGVVIAIGHTAADPETLHRAVDAGARLSTHLGNGIAATLPRHPNAIWTQAADDRLVASLIADGHHLSRDVLRVLARAKGPYRVILVSDASPLAGLPVGVHGEWAVDPSGKIVVTGTPYLAGSNQGLEVGINRLLDATDWPLADVLATSTTNPARLLDLPEPTLEVGRPANIVRYRCEWDERGASTFHLLDTCVDGAWSGPETATSPPFSL